MELVVGEIRCVMATRTPSLSEEDLPTQLRLIGKRIRFAGSPSVPRRVSAQSRPLVVGDGPGESFCGDLG